MLLILITLLHPVAEAAAAAAAEELRFLPCGAAPETWKVTATGQRDVLSRTNLVALNSGGGKGCISAGASGVVATAPCNASDLAQSWEWNGTAKNALPKGAAGFVRSALPTLGCSAKGGDGSEGCCLTNNGPATVWGCCPYIPSDCGNQVITLHADGTLRDARHPSDCLMHGAAPPTPAPPPPLGDCRRGRCYHSGRSRLALAVLHRDSACKINNRSGAGRDDTTGLVQAIGSRPSRSSG